MTYKAALIGAGMVARTHLAACAELSDRLTVTGILSQSGVSAARLAEEAKTLMDTPICVYETIDDIMDDDMIDFVIIATPPNIRHALIEPLAKAGKHILLEKPVGRTAEEASQIVQICKRAEVELGIVFQHRVRAASQKARDFVNSGRLGALGLVEISVPWWREQSYYDVAGRGSYDRDGGGVLISQAIHTIDLALSLAGPVKSVTAMATTTKFHDMESEDFVVAGLQFTNGAAGSLVASTASFPGASETITLHFERASLTLNAGVLMVTWRDGKHEEFGANATTGGGADPMAFTHDWHQAIIENFLDRVAGTAELFASGDDALAAHNFIQAITRAAATKTEQVLKS